MAVFLWMVFRFKALDLAQWTTWKKYLAKISLVIYWWAEGLVQILCDNRFSVSIGWKFALKLEGGRAVYNGTTGAQQTIKISSLLSPHRVNWICAHNHQNLHSRHQAANSNKLLEKFWFHRLYMITSLTKTPSPFLTVLSRSEIGRKGGWKPSH